MKLKAAPILGLLVRLLFDMEAMIFRDDAIGWTMIGIFSAEGIFFGLGEESKLFFDPEVFPRKLGVDLISGNVKRLLALFEF